MYIAFNARIKYLSKLAGISFLEQVNMSFDPEKTTQLLSELRSNAPEEFQQTFIDIEDNWERKLWHQLTDVLVNFFSDPDSSPVRTVLFLRFVSSFADKINQLKFIHLALLVAPDYESEGPSPADITKLTWCLSRCAAPKVL